MTVLTRVICQRAGWDYDQVRTEQRVAAKRQAVRRPHLLVGYGAYFSAPAGLSDAFTDLLRAQIDQWNGREEARFHLACAVFDGRVMGEGIGDFVFFPASRESFGHLAQPMAAHHATFLAPVGACPEFADPLYHFLTILALSGDHPGIVIQQGVIQLAASLPA